MNPVLWMNRAHRAPMTESRRGYRPLKGDRPALFIFKKSFFPAPLIKFPRQNSWSNRAPLYFCSFYPLLKIASLMLKNKPRSHSTIMVKWLIINRKVLCWVFLPFHSRKCQSIFKVIGCPAGKCELCCSLFPPNSLVGWWCEAPAI